MNTRDQIDRHRWRIKMLVKYLMDTSCQPQVSPDFCLKWIKYHQHMIAQKLTLLEQPEYDLIEQ